MHRPSSTVRHRRQLWRDVRCPAWSSRRARRGPTSELRQGERHDRSAAVARRLDGLGDDGVYDAPANRVDGRPGSGCWRTGLAGALPGWHVNPFPVPDDTAAAEAAEDRVLSGAVAGWAEKSRATHLRARHAGPGRRCPRSCAGSSTARTALGDHRRAPPGRGARSLLRDTIVDERPRVF